MASRIAGLVLIVACAGGARAAELTVGDPAPPLTVSKWVKGAKLDRLAPGQPYVVEFWATWCGPCIEGIPHLTKLQAAYQSQGLTVVGVSVWEQDQADVVPFVQQMGDKMNYRVALDDVPTGADPNQGKMAKAWLSAAGEDGIPTAFVVDKAGKIAWIGRPAEMDAPLAKIVAGKWDLVAAAADRREGKAREKRLQALMAKLQKFDDRDDPKLPLAIVDKALGEDPKLEPTLGTVKLGLLLLCKDYPGASTYAGRLIDGIYKDDAPALSTIAWQLADPDRDGGDRARRDLKLAQKAAVRATQLTKGEDPGALDSLALVLFESGDRARALPLQERAVKLAGDLAQDSGMTARLEKYRKASAAPAR